MMNKRVYVFTIVVCQMLAVNAQTLSDKLYDHFDYSKVFFETVYDNPAMQSGKYSTSLTEIDLNWKGSHSSTPIKLEYGDGSTFWGGQAKAFINKGNSSLWGKATYNNGRVRNIKFCESSNFEIVAPYVMADTVGGGNSKQEIYDFTGGFAHRINDKWVIGAEGRYSATMDYRVKDPRPKNLSGDLNVKVGTSYNMGSQLLGASVSFRRYKQTNELEFYDEVSIPTVYHLTGLGTDYYRFRGKNTSTYYQGMGGGFTVNTKPMENTGVYASFGYSYLSLDKIISSLNELPMATLSHHNQQFEVGYQHASSVNTWGVKVKEQYYSKRGTENIFGSAADNIYPQIAEEAQYKNNVFDVALEGMYQLHIDKAMYSIVLHQGYESMKETHAEPSLLMKSSSIVSALKANALWLVGQLVVSAHVGCQHSWSCSNELDLGDALNSTLSLPTKNYYEYLSSNRSSLDCGAKVGYDMKYGYGLYMAYNMNYVYYMKGEKTRNMNISIGIEF